MFPRRSLVPLEVCERVINAVSLLKVTDNLTIANQELRRNTLLACALTCRAWLFRSRYHLHRDVKMFDKHQLERFVGVLRDTPDIQTFVCTLSTGSRPQRGKIEEWLHLIPLYLAIVLRNLYTLRIHNCDWRALHPSFFMAIKHFTAVTSLTLQTVKLGTSRELVKLVFAFPSLTELTIREVQCIKDRPCRLFKRAKRQLPLQFLLFRRGLIGFPLLQLLDETGSNSLIHSLDMELNPEAAEMGASGGFLKGCIAIRFLFIQIPLVVKECGTSVFLRYAVDSANTTTDHTVFTHVSVEHARHLKKFKYSSILSPSNFAFLVHILGTVPPGAISKIFVKFWGGWNPKLETKMQAMQEIDWNSLDLVLSSTRYSTLTDLCIEIDYLDGLNALPEFLRKQLPRLHKKGVLVEELDIER